jgi:hypothetical protein
MATLQQPFRETGAVFLSRYQFLIGPAEWSGFFCSLVQQKLRTMSYSVEQITEKGNQPRHVSKGRSAKTQKKNRHRWMRQKLKNLDFVPQHNRYTGGWFE